MSNRSRSAWFLSLSIGLLGSAGVVRGQGPTVDPALPSPPGGGGSTLGSAPGAGLDLFGGNPGSGDQIIGGRPGSSTPRVPSSISTPGGSQARPDQGAIETPKTLSPSDVPILGSLAIPRLIDDSTPGSLGLDEAIDRLVRDNLELKAQYLEIPQAQADILTASLRANPVLYADSQLIPYGRYSAQRPGGQTQYDVNISYPLDVTRKRQARTVVACRAKKVLEAQFQNAVRLQIDNLYTSYVDLLAARGAVKFSEVGVTGLSEALNAIQVLQGKGERNAADVRRMKIQFDNAQIGLVSNKEAYQRAKRAFGQILAIPPEEAEGLEPKGTLINQPIGLPSSQELIQMAYQARPDLAAFRLGVSRAEADVQLARANRLNDVYVLLQPYTFQDNTPQGLKSSASYAVGVTVPLPIYNRNQGNIQRARLNVTQTQIQLASLERQIQTEVRQAEQEYKLSLASVQQLETKVNPAAERVLSDSLILLKGGESNLLDYLNARSQYNDVARQYLDTLVRYRRSILNLNTVVGQRLLP